MEKQNQKSGEQFPETEIPESSFWKAVKKILLILIGLFLVYLMLSYVWVGYYILENFAKFMIWLLFLLHVDWKKFQSILDRESSRDRQPYDSILMFKMLKFAVTTAKVHDGQIDLSKKEEIVYRDKGYSEELHQREL